MHQEKFIQALPEVSNGFSFKSQNDYENPPTVPYIENTEGLTPSEASAGDSSTSPRFVHLTRETKT